MSRTEARIAEYFVKLNTFRASGRYADVTVVFPDGSFKCHHIALTTASDYFDKLFGGKLRREYLKIDTLSHVMDAATFEQVLQFIYTGSATITPDNVYNLLQASLFLRISEMEELCVEFVLENINTVHNKLKILLFAHATKKSSLVNALTNHITENFELFCGSSEFLEIPFDIFGTVLFQCKSSSEDVLLDAIIQWIGHSREERLPYFEYFSKKIQFQKVSPEYMTFVVERYIQNSSIIKRIIGSVEYEGIVSQKQTYLNIYVQYTQENLMRCFSVKDLHNCSISYEISHPGTESMRTVADDSFLYCLNYSRDVLDSSFQQKFCSCNSINMSVKQPLRPPPLVVCEFSMCYLQNQGIFLYDEFLFSHKIKTNTYTAAFEDEKMSRGLFLYKQELDAWFPIPMMKKDVEESCMAVCEDTLYLIGGGNRDDSFPENYAQAYDHRSGTWRQLPQTNFLYAGASCCTMKGKLYISGGYKNCIALEMYDPVAGKWQILECMNKKSEYHRMVPYANRLWAMAGFIDNRPTNDLLIDVYNPLLNRWSIESILKEAAQGTTPTTIVEAIVFPL